MTVRHRGIFKSSSPFYLLPSCFGKENSYFHKTIRFQFSLTNSIVLLFLCGLSGCTGNGGEPIHDLGKVTGIITLDGTSLSKANETFQPEVVGDKSRSRASSAIISADSQFKLDYNSNVSGASIGKHKVIISKMSDNPEDAGLQLVPTKSNNATELTADVVAGENTINFDLNSK